VDEEAISRAAEPKKIIIAIIIISAVYFQPDSL
jgi:hypothetical protein